MAKTNTENNKIHNYSANKEKSDSKSGGYIKKKPLLRDIKLSTDDRLIVNPEQVRGVKPNYQPNTGYNDDYRSNSNYKSKYRSDSKHSASDEGSKQGYSKDNRSSNYSRPILDHKPKHQNNYSKQTDEQKASQQENFAKVAVEQKQTNYSKQTVEQKASQQENFAKPAVEQKPKHTHHYSKQSVEQKANQQENFAKPAVEQKSKLPNYSKQTVEQKASQQENFAKPAVEQKPKHTHHYSKQSVEQKANTRDNAPTLNSDESNPTKDFQNRNSFRNKPKYSNNDNNALFDDKAQTSSKKVNAESIIPSEKDKLSSAPTNKTLSDKKENNLPAIVTIVNQKRHSPLNRNKNLIQPNSQSQVKSDTFEKSTIDGQSLNNQEPLTKVNSNTQRVEPKQNPNDRTVNTQRAESKQNPNDRTVNTQRAEPKQNLNDRNPNDRTVNTQRAESKQNLNDRNSNDRTVNTQRAESKQNLNDRNPNDRTVNTQRVEPKQNSNDRTVNTQRVESKQNLNDKNPNDRTVNTQRVEPKQNPNEKTVNTQRVESKQNPNDRTANTQRVESKQNPNDRTVNTQRVESKQNSNDRTANTQRVESKINTEKLSTERVSSEIIENSNAESQRLKPQQKNNSFRSNNSQNNNSRNNNFRSNNSQNNNWQKNRNSNATDFPNAETNKAEDKRGESSKSEVEPILTIISSKTIRLPFSKKNQNKQQNKPIESVSVNENISEREVKEPIIEEKNEIIRLPFSKNINKHKKENTTAKILDLASDAIVLPNETISEVVTNEEYKKETASQRNNRRKKFAKKLKAEKAALEAEQLLKSGTVQLDEISSEADKPIEEVSIEKVVAVEKEVKEKSDNRNKHKNTKFQNKHKYTNEKIELDDPDEIIDPLVMDPNYIKTTFEVAPEPIKKLKKNPNDDLVYSKISSKMLINPDKPSNPTVEALLKKFEYSLTEELFVAEGARIMVAVSGGVDSISLLDMFAQLSEKYKFTLIVAHFNHNLRGLSSDEDEELVRKISEKYALKVYTNSENIMAYASANSISIEQAARVRRYKMFERLAGNLKINFVATAHTSDDSAETFLLNLMRGTGLTGLTGIPKKRILTKNSHLIRPIINIKKSDIYEYAKERKLAWREDETNALTNYTRNKIRLDLLPKLKEDFSPAIIETINKTAAILRGADDFINTYVNGLLQILIKDRRKDRYYINIPQLQTFTEFIQSEIIQQSVVKVFKSLPITSNTIDRILSLCESPSGSICDINKNAFVLKDRNHLVFSIKSSTFKVDMQIERTGEYDLGTHILRLTEVQRKTADFNKDTNIEYIDAELIPSYLQLRSWETGDIFQPLGMEGHVKVSDFLSNIKVPIMEKQNIILLTTKSEIIWVVGKRLSNKYKISKTSKKVIKAEFILKAEKNK